MSSASGAIAVVTGGGRGIGLGIGRSLAAAGYSVALWDRDADNVETAAKTLRASGGDAIGLACDIASVDDVNRAAEETQRKLGIPYLLVNNAGTRHRARLEDLSRADWDQEVAVNLSGAFQCTQTLGRRMLAAGRGVIVNIASMSAYIGHPLRGAYSPSKAGLLGLTNLTAVEWGARGIRCNAISPGIIVTPAHEAVYSNPTASEGRRAFVPLGRLGDSSDIGDVVVFLASEAARFVNGVNLPVDGGTSQSLISLMPTLDPQGKHLNAARDALSSGS
jgi:NAD(P)-dependent dehydrogenase (short-subunit alcohol dehydrogenase family)